MQPLSSNARNVSLCPFCRELIAKGAARCPYCHGDLKVPSLRKKRPFYATPFMLGFYFGTIFWIGLMLLYFWKY
jgi:hypothetical protein